MFERHNVFVSYHHKNDQYYKERFYELFGHLFINKSVGLGEIATDNSTDYTKRLIQQDYISECSVLVVLIGRETYCRKHVDWEISAALNKKVGGYSGLIGICIPGNPDYPGPSYQYAITPARFVDNQKSGYANYYDWTEDPAIMYYRVHDAFLNRVNKSHLIDNSSLQMQRNLCGDQPLAFRY